MTLAHSALTPIPTALIERLEVASGNFGGIEAWDIAGDLSPWGSSGLRTELLVSAMEGSLDAALALAERVLPGWRWTMAAPSESRRVPDAYFARIESPDFDCVTWEAGDKCTTDVLAGRDAFAYAATPALALCLAVLKARTASAVGMSEANAQKDPRPASPVGVEALALRLYRHLTNYAEICAARRESIEKVRDDVFAALSAPSGTGEAVAWTSLSNLEILRSGRGAANMWATPHRTDSVALYAAPSPTAMSFARDLAAYPCETKSADDMEVGCCGPCRARQAIGATS